MTPVRSPQKCRRRDQERLLFNRMGIFVFNIDFCDIESLGNSEYQNRRSGYQQRKIGMLPKAEDRIDSVEGVKLLECSETVGSPSLTNETTPRPAYHSTAENWQLSRGAMAWSPLLYILEIVPNRLGRPIKYSPKTDQTDDQLRRSFNIRFEGGELEWFFTRVSR